MENKELNKLIVGIVVVGLVLVIGIYIVATMGTEMRSNVVATGTNTAEELSEVNSTVTQTFAIIATVPTARCDVTNVTNTTDEVFIEATGNYTLPTSCQIVAVATSPFANVSWTVSYDYAYDTTEATAASNASEDVTSALSNGTPWLTILLVVTFAVIVLGMLIGGLGGATRGAGPTY